MPRDGYTNLTLPDETYDQLCQARESAGEPTWGEFFTLLLEDADVDGLQTGALSDRVSRLEDRVSDLEQIAGHH